MLDEATKQLREVFKDYVVTANRMVNGQRTTEEGRAGILVMLLMQMNENLEDIKELLKKEEAEKKTTRTSK